MNPNTNSIHHLFRCAAAGRSSPSSDSPSAADLPSPIRTFRAEEVAGSEPPSFPTAASEHTSMSTSDRLLHLSTAAAAAAHQPRSNALFQEGKSNNPKTAEESTSRNHKLSSVQHKKPPSSTRTVAATAAPPPLQDPHPPTSASSTSVHATTNISAVVSDALLDAISRSFATSFAAANANAQKQAAKTSKPEHTSSSVRIIEEPLKYDDNTNNDARNFVTTFTVPRITMVRRKSSKKKKSVMRTHHGWSSSSSSREGSGSSGGRSSSSSESSSVDGDGESGSYGEFEPRRFQDCTALPINAHPSSSASADGNNQMIHLTLCAGLAPPTRTKTNTNTNTDNNASTPIASSSAVAAVVFERDDVENGLVVKTQSANDHRQPHFLRGGHTPKDGHRSKSERRPLLFHADEVFVGSSSTRDETSSTQTTHESHSTSSHLLAEEIFRTTAGLLTTPADTDGGEVKIRHSQTEFQAQHPALVINMGTRTDGAATSALLAAAADGVGNDEEGGDGVVLSYISEVLQYLEQANLLPLYTVRLTAAIVPLAQDTSRSKAEMKSRGGNELSSPSPSSSSCISYNVLRARVTRRERRTMRAERKRRLLEEEREEAAKRGNHNNTTNGQQHNYQHMLYPNTLESMFGGYKPISRTVSRQPTPRKVGGGGGGISRASTPSKALMMSIGASVSSSSAAITAGNSAGGLFDRQFSAAAAPSLMTPRRSFSSPFSNTRSGGQGQGQARRSSDAIPNITRTLSLIEEEDNNAEDSANGSSTFISPTQMRPSSPSFRPMTFVDTVSIRSVRQARKILRYVHKDALRSVAAGLRPSLEEEAPNAMAAEPSSSYSASKRKRTNRLCCAMGWGENKDDVTKEENNQSGAPRQPVNNAFEIAAARKMLGLPTDDFANQSPTSNQNGTAKNGMNNSSLLDFIRERDSYLSDNSSDYSTSDESGDNNDEIDNLNNTTNGGGGGDANDLSRRRSGAHFIAITTATSRTTSVVFNHGLSPSSANNKSNAAGNGDFDFAGKAPRPRTKISAAHTSSPILPLHHLILTVRVEPIHHHNRTAASHHHPSTSVIPTPSELLSSGGGGGGGGLLQAIRPAVFVDVRGFESASAANGTKASASISPRDGIGFLDFLANIGTSSHTKNAAEEAAVGFGQLAELLAPAVVIPLSALSGNKSKKKRGPSSSSSTHSHRKLAASAELLLSKVFLAAHIGGDSLSLPSPAPAMMPPSPSSAPSSPLPAFAPPPSLLGSIEMLQRLVVARFGQRGPQRRLVLVSFVRPPTAPLMMAPSDTDSSCLNGKSADSFAAATGGRVRTPNNNNNSAANRSERTGPRSVSAPKVGSARGARPAHAQSARRRDESRSAVAASEFFDYNTTATTPMPMTLPHTPPADDNDEKHMRTVLKVATYYRAVAYHQAAMRRRVLDTAMPQVVKLERRLQEVETDRGMLRVALEVSRGEVDALRTEVAALRQQQQRHHAASNGSPPNTTTATTMPSANLNALFPVTTTTNQSTVALSGGGINSSQASPFAADTSIFASNTATKHTTDEGAAAKDAIATLRASLALSQAQCVSLTEQVTAAGTNAAAQREEAVEAVHAEYEALIDGLHDEIRTLRSELAEAKAAHGNNPHHHHPHHHSADFTMDARNSFMSSNSNNNHHRCGQPEGRNSDAVLLGDELAAARHQSTTSHSHNHSLLPLPSHPFAVSRTTSIASGTVAYRNNSPLPQQQQQQQQKQRTARFSSFAPTSNAQNTESPLGDGEDEGEADQMPTRATVLIDRTLQQANSDAISRIVGVLESAGLVEPKGPVEATLEGTLGQPAAGRVAHQMRTTTALLQLVHCVAEREKTIGNLLAKVEQLTRERADEALASTSEEYQKQPKATSLPNNNAPTSAASGFGLQPVANAASSVKNTRSSTAASSANAATVTGLAAAASPTNKSTLLKHRRERLSAWQAAADALRHTPIYGHGEWRLVLQHVAKEAMRAWQREELLPVLRAEAEELSVGAGAGLVDGGHDNSGEAASFVEAHDFLASDAFNVIPLWLSSVGAAAFPSTHSIFATAGVAIPLRFMFGGGPPGRVKTAASKQSSIASNLFELATKGTPKAFAHYWLSSPQGSFVVTGEKRSTKERAPRPLLFVRAEEAEAANRLARQEGENSGLRGVPPAAASSSFSHQAVPPRPPHPFEERQMLPLLGDDDEDFEPIRSEVAEDECGDAVEQQEKEKNEEALLVPRQLQPQPFPFTSSGGGNAESNNAAPSQKTHTTRNTREGADGDEGNALGGARSRSALSSVASGGAESESEFSDNRTFAAAVSHHHHHQHHQTTAASCIPHQAALSAAAVAANFVFPPPPTAAIAPTPMVDAEEQPHTPPSQQPLVTNRTLVFEAPPPTPQPHPHPPLAGGEQAPMIAVSSPPNTAPQMNNDEPSAVPPPNVAADVMSSPPRFGDACDTAAPTPNVAKDATAPQRIDDDVDASNVGASKERHNQSAEEGPPLLESTASSMQPPILLLSPPSSKVSKPPSPASPSPAATELAVSHTVVAGVQSTPTVAVWKEVPSLASFEKKTTTKTPTASTVQGENEEVVPNLAEGNMSRSASPSGASNVSSSATAVAKFRSGTPPLYPKAKAEGKSGGRETEEERRIRKENEKKEKQARKEKEKQEKQAMKEAQHEEKRALRREERARKKLSEVE